MHGRDEDDGIPPIEDRWEVNILPDLDEGADGQPPPLPVIDEFSTTPTALDCSEEESEPEPELPELPNPFALDRLELDDVVVLDWKTRATLVDLDRSVQAILDPTRERSTWVQPDAAVGDIHNLTVEIGSWRAIVSVVVEAGESEILHLGRDVLQGNILIRS